MLSFLDQIFTLLATAPGSLTYHLIVTFSIMAALALAGRPWNRRNARRVAGLAGLLGGRLVLFALALLALSGLASEHILLPPVDRAVTTLSLVVVIWLWAFPNRSAAGDIAALLAGLLVLVAGVFTGVLWAGQSVGTAFAATGLDAGWQVFSALVALGGAALLLVRRPPGWGSALWMVGLLGLGHLGALLFPETARDFPGLLRLAHLAAYPLLFSLPALAGGEREPGAAKISLITPIRKRFNSDAKTLDYFLALATEEDPARLCPAITRAISQAMLADICFLITAPDSRGDILVQCGYDLIREHDLPGGLVHQDSLPLIAASVVKNRPLRLPGSSTSLDLATLSKALDLEQLGHLLVAPITQANEPPFGAVILASPHSRRNWSAEDQEYLVKVGASLAKIIQAPRKPAPAPPPSEEEAALAQLSADLAAAQAEAAQARADNQALLTELLLLREEAAQPPPGDEGLAPLLEARDRALARISELEYQVESLRAASRNGAPLQDETLQQKIDILLIENEEAQGVIAYLQDELEKLRSQRATSGLFSREEVESRPGGRETLALLEAENKQLQQTLVDTDARLKEEYSGRLASLESAQEEAFAMAEAAIASLQSENEAVKAALEQARAAAAPAQSPTTPLEGELRIALEEIARLQKLAGETEVKLVHAQKQAEAAPKSRRKWQMIAALAQDLRQPMSSIVGYTDFLLSESVGILGALQRKFLERVKVSTERMNRMVEDLMKIAEMETGEFELTFTRVDLPHAIDNAVAAITPQFREKEHLLRVDLPDDLPQIEADETAIQQILTHLLQNAGSVTPHEGVITIQAQAESYGHEEDYVLVRMSDSGPGISPDDLPHVFDQRMSAEKSLVYGLGDSNLGLTLAKSLVEAHSGRIWVDSAAGTGTTFSLLLPQTQAQFDGLRTRRP